MSGEYQGGYGRGRGGYQGGGQGGGQSGQGGRYGGGGRGESGGRSGGERRGIPLSDLDPALTAVSHKVIGCARDVHMNLGPGYAESVYIEALKHEFTAQGIPFEVARSYPVRYKDATVGQIITDFVIDGKFVLEVMCEFRDVSSGDRAALRAQLKASDLTLGLITNFAGRRLTDGLVRVLNVDKIRAERGEDFHDDAQDGGHDGGVDFDDRS
ncbi:MAG: GxxExxY protein [Tepidisphaera sp.]|jgi:GxxExxY protein